MRTTVKIRSPLLADAKKRAAEKGVTLSEIVEEALVIALAGSRVNRSGGRKLALPVYAGHHPTRVDLADRDSLYDGMEGKG